MTTNCLFVAFIDIVKQQRVKHLGSLNIAEKEEIFDCSGGVY